MGLIWNPKSILTFSKVPQESSSLIFVGTHRLGLITDVTLSDRHVLTRKPDFKCQN